MTLRRLNRAWVRGQLWLLAHLPEHKQQIRVWKMSYGAVCKLHESEVASCQKLEGTVARLTTDLEAMTADRNEAEQHFAIAQSAWETARLVYQDERSELEAKVEKLARQLADARRVRRRTKRK